MVNNTSNGADNIGANSKENDNSNKQRRKYHLHNNNKDKGPKSSYDQFEKYVTSLLTDAASSESNSSATSELGRIQSKSNKYSNQSMDIAGEFDLYLFAQVWSPNFCCNNKKQCKQQDKSGLDDLTIHGLWPAYYQAKVDTKKTFPSYCTISTPSITAIAGVHGHDLHEWKKHGTCSALDVTQYKEEGFKLENDTAILRMREHLNDTAGNILDLHDFLRLHGGNKKIAIMSTTHCQLKEITTCWAKEEGANKVGQQIDCPPHVLHSSRNSALLYGCKKVILDAAANGECTFITKEFLQEMKRKI